MVSTAQSNLNQKTIIPSIKPEVIEFFQNEVDPKITPEQIENIIGSLKPKSQPNPIFGQILNLLYMEDGTNLVSIVMQDNSSGNLYTLSSDFNINAESEIIEVVNLKDFQFRLQEAFNYQSLVNIYREDNQINSLVIIAKQIEEFNPQIASIGIPSPGAVCSFGSPPC